MMKTLKTIAIVAAIALPNLAAAALITVVAIPEIMGAQNGAYAEAEV